jgi:hypothetical protein
MLPSAPTSYTPGMARKGHMPCAPTIGHGMPCPNKYNRDGWGIALFNITRDCFGVPFGLVWLVSEIHIITRRRGDAEKTIIRRVRRLHWLWRWSFTMIGRRHIWWITRNVDTIYGHRGHRGTQRNTINRAIYSVISVAPCETILKFYRPW